MRIVLPLLAGCGDLTRGEVEDLLRADLDLLADIQVRADSIETWIGEAGHGSRDGLYVIDGTLGPDGVIEAGSLTAQGTGSSDRGGTLLTWDLVIGLDGVVIDGIEMDGELDVQMSVVATSPDLSVAYAFAGTQVLSGAIEGTGQVDVRVTASAAEGGRPNWEGTVNGFSARRVME